MNQAQTTLLVLYATAIKFPSTPTLGTNFLTVTNCLGEKGASNDHNSTHQLKDDERQCLSTGCHGVRAESAVQIWDSSTQQCQTCGWELPIFFLFFFSSCNKQTISDCDKDQIPLASSSFASSLCAKHSIGIRIAFAPSSISTQ